MLRYDDISESKNWILLAAVIFFGSFIIAAVTAVIQTDFVIRLFSQFFKDIQDIGEQIFGSNPFWGTWRLFLNNFRASLVFMFGGIIFTIPSFVGLAFNGGAVGALGVISILDGINPLIFILAIIPHGIFEIPAILISGGLGLKIGTELLKPKESITRFNNFKINLMLIVKTLPLIIILLLIAAVVEIFVTPNLLGLFVDF